MSLLSLSLQERKNHKEDGPVKAHPKRVKFSIIGVVALNDPRNWQLLPKLMVNLMRCSSGHWQR